jgi:hypothetical protein
MKRFYLLVQLLFCFAMFPVSMHAQTVLHYWNYNNSASVNELLTPTFSLVGSPSLTHLTGGISSVQFTGNTGQGFDVTNPNARNGDAALTHLRFNDPIGGGLLFSLPTTGYDDIIVKYATRRSGSGAGTQRIDYSVDGTNFISFGTINPVDGDPALATLDFSAIAEAGNNANFKIRITFEQGAGGTVGNNRFDNFTLEGTALPVLLHYWNFNNSASLSALLAPTSSVGSASLSHIPGGISAIPITGNTTGQGFETTNPNARNGDEALSHLRFNDPIGGGLLFSIPTSGYTDIVIRYATRRSGSGAGSQLIEYSTDGSSFTSFGTINPVDGNPTLATLDFSSLDATDNNPDFQVRITFAQGTGGTGGNNRFDNVTVEGFSSGTADTNPPTVTFSPLNDAVNLATTVTPAITFNEDIRLVDNTALTNASVDDVVELRLNDAAGAAVSFDATISGKVITIVPAAQLLNGQKYYVAVKANMIEDFSDNALTAVQAASFTTIVPQTQFAPGDIVFVAYRTNASTPDEVAFLTFVDILPGTLINFTDAKYTDNAQPQCPGGFVWTAPAGGIKAGSVITILVDNPFSASAGTVSGSSFGLSSGGEQVIVYTGTAASPGYITAISTNAWLTANTSCSGSLSKLPASLTDGQTSMNMSTAPGNVSANTVNAYYNGSQTLEGTALRTSILNPANWVGTGAGTPAQTWPAWTFGSPYIVSASVLNQTTLSLVFSKQMDEASAETSGNYTGIAGLQSVTLAEDKMTVTLVFATPFVKGSANTLHIAGITDVEAQVMIAYDFSFTYTTEISFEKKFIQVREEAGTLAIKIKIKNPSESSVDLVVKPAPFSTASAEDFTLVTQTLTFNGASDIEHTINIPVINDNAAEQEEYLALSLENASGAAVTGGNFMTIFIHDNDRQAPVPTKEIELTHVGSFDPGSSTAEIVMHDPVSQRLFVISSVQSRLDIADFSDPTEITLIKSVDMAPYGGITSVAVKNEIVAVASPNADPMANGSVVFLTTDGVFIRQVTVGVLPDMITFSPDGLSVMTANEGQPNDSYTVDPEGSVSIIDISGGIESLEQTDVTTLLFTGFNSQEAELIAAGVRKLKSSSTLSQDFEPEYITVSADSKKAWVTIQENNAIGEIDLETKSITSVWPLGKKDLGVFGSGIDASDNSGIVTIANWPVKAFYIPDAIANYSVGGTHYLVTANEGDEKEYAGLTERTTVGAVTLDPAVFPHAAFLKENHNLGRLRMSNLSGDANGDGLYEEINIPGGRSFTIWNAATRTRVYDSGDDFEQFTSTEPSIAPLFNSDNEGNAFKGRSRAKGPEPEGLTIASLGGKTFAFIALERVGGIMVYNITDPGNVKFVDYQNSRNISSYGGDNGPEGVVYISPDSSPNGNAYILIANEISGTVSVFEISSTQAIAFGVLEDKTVGDAPFALTATASSGLPVSYRTDDAEISIAAGQVTLQSAGRVTIIASQEGSGPFEAAAEVSQSFCVNPAKPVITVTNETGDPVLHSSAATGNQWYKDGDLLEGAIQASLPVTTVGVYTVTQTAETCTSVTSDDYVLVITGFEENGAKHALRIYPNPATDAITLELRDAGTKEISIYQSSGAVKETFATAEGQLEVSLGSYSTGYYIVRMATQNGIYYGKFIKK